MLVSSFVRTPTGTPGPRIIHVAFETYVLMMSSLSEVSLLNMGTP